MPSTNRLFHAFAVAGLDFGDLTTAPADDASVKSFFRIRYLYPKNKDTIKLSRSVCQFGFPENAAKLFQLKSDNPQSAFYTFILTAEDGTKLYGHCLRTLPLGSRKQHDIQRRYPECFCFVSRTHHRTFFESLLTMAAYCR